MKKVKALKARERHRDFEKKRNMRVTELKQIFNHTRKDFGTFFPKSRKYPVGKTPPVTIDTLKSIMSRSQPADAKRLSWWNRLVNWIKRIIRI